MGVKSGVEGVLFNELVDCVLEGGEVGREGLGETVVFFWGGKDRGKSRRGRVKRKGRSVERVNI